MFHPERRLRPELAPHPAHLQINYARVGFRPIEVRGVEPGTCLVHPAR